jgi:RimJ/RimL family protein N-acetyltransferase
MAKPPVLMQKAGYGLRKLTLEDANERYLSWIADPDVNCFLTVGKFPPTIEELREYIANFEDNRNAIAFAIIDTKENMHVGNATINAINWISGTADLGLMIGDKAYLGKDCAYVIWSMIIKHAFEVLGLRRLYIGILEGNKECLNAAIKLGCIEEGRWRQHSLVNGEYQDEIWFGVLRDEASKIHLQQ